MDLKGILEIKEKFYSKDNILKNFKIDDENIVLTFEESLTYSL